MADVVQQPNEDPSQQIELSSSVSHGSPSSAHSSELTALSVNPPISNSSPGRPEAIPSPLGSDDDANRGIAYNTAVPAHVIHRPAPQNALPCKNVPEWTQLESGLKFLPVSPTTMSSWRYDDRARAPGDVDALIIEPTEIEPSDFVSPDWTPCTHPEGHLYYRRECQVSGRKEVNAIYTDQDLEDPSTLKLVNFCVERFIHYMSHDCRVPLDFELVMYAYKKEGEDAGIFVHYYLSTDARRRISWFQPVSSGLVTNNERSVRSKARLRDAWEFQYWAHKELFPNHWHVTRQMIAQLTESLRYLANDSRTSETSTAPWDFATLNDHIGIVKELDPDTCTGHSSCIVARLMHTLAKSRFQHHHGEQWARLNINQSVKEDLSQKDLKRSLWFLCLQPLCFYLPDKYLGELENLFVDDLLHYTQWNLFINGLKNDWDTIMLPVTVLLTVNVGLLAIQSLDNGHADRSIAQLSSYCSAIMSLGAILMCIILSRHHRTSGHSSDMANVGDWLKGQVKTQPRAELFVITLSLPSVWFTWGVIMFCVALLWVAFDRTSWVTRTAVGIVALPTLAVVSWVIVAAWKHKHRRAYLTGRLCALVKSQCTRAQGSVSAWIATLRRPSSRGGQERLDQTLSEKSAV